MPVTMMDVAKAAGVSMKTVSRVINREENVRDRLRVKVEAAIAELGYVPNLAARSLAAGRAFRIGVLLDNPSPNYTMKIQDGAYAACRRLGYQLVIEHIDTQGADVAADMQAMLRNRPMDGMLVTPPATESAAVMDGLEALAIPYARMAPTDFVGRSLAVGMDDRAAAAEMAKHLWDLGHRRFGIVNGPCLHGASGQRREGFLAALAERGVAREDVMQASGDFTFHSGIGAGLGLLRDANRPTAIFAANDDMAAGIFAAAAQIGLIIPRDLSVAGFDDSWIAESVWPGLTTIHQPIAEMAALAVEQLIARQDEAPTGDQAMMLDYRLIRRASTGPAPF